MAKKRNPQDATLRNIRSLKKRVGKLETRFKDERRQRLEWQRWVEHLLKV
jgi:hypothetical protein